MPTCNVLCYLKQAQMRWADSLICTERMISVIFVFFFCCCWEAFLKSELGNPKNTVINFETEVKIFCNSLSRDNKNRQLPKQEITVVTWKPLTLSFLFAPFPRLQEQLTITGRKPLRTGSKGGYFEESVIGKKKIMAGWFRICSCKMHVCLPSTMHKGFQL